MSLIYVLGWLRSNKSFFDLETLPIIWEKSSAMNIKAVFANRGFTLYNYFQNRALHHQ